MTNLEQIKGRILYIGISYYNNWYLSRALRKSGWQADVLFCSGEGAEQYTHGTDFYLHEYLNWDGQYEPKRFEFLRSLLSSYAETFKKQRESGKSSRTFMPLKWLANLLGRLPPELTIHILLVSWRLLLKHIKLYVALLLAAPSHELLRKLFHLFIESMRTNPLPELEPLYDVLDRYDILHFTGVQNLRYFYFIGPHFDSMPIGWDIELLRILGKRIVYSNTGCLDGVTQSSFRKWEGPEVVCDICPWRERPDVCSDERNRNWGELRNQLTDYIVTLGGNRADFNADPKVHEVPEFYCLDPDLWSPDLEIPSEFQLTFPPGTVKIYHAVGNYDFRTDPITQQNIKSTHIYIPLIERLKREGYPVELIFAKDIPNKDVRYYQVQADIVVDMLTFGFFGANVREALMLGKPAICYLRPEWLESMRQEIPEYVDEIPVISATPETIYDVLIDLIRHPEKRVEIGRRSREFAIKWHSAEAGARRFDQIYSDLLRKA